jgi:hypothetical protein
MLPSVIITNNMTNSINMGHTGLMPIMSLKMHWHLIDKMLTTLGLAMMMLEDVHKLILNQLVILH